MNDREFNPLFEENFKDIEDIIDSRKLLGQYNVQPTVHGRYAYSQPSHLSENMDRYEDALMLNEGDCINSSNIKKTDSEITLVRVKISESTLKRRRSKWDMHDIAIPGDGSHLAESPSLVNLVTLVGDIIPCEGEEYLVPISSWDPYFKAEEFNNRSQTNLNDQILEEAQNDMSEVKEEHIENSVSRKPSWAGKISNFIKKHIGSKEPSLTKMDSTKN